MTAPFNLRFIIRLQADSRRIDLKDLVPYQAPADMPTDSAGELPLSYFRRYEEVERRKCDELEKLSDRFQCEALHFVVGFMLEDYVQVAVCDQIRRHRVREAVCALIRSVEKEHGADKIDWLVAMHLDSEVPHVHVAMSRYASQGPLLKRIDTLPAGLLPLN